LLIGSWREEESGQWKVEYKHTHNTHAHNPFCPAGLLVEWLSSQPTTNPSDPRESEKKRKKRGNTLK
jgi:hypothetical protein